MEFSSIIYEKKGNICILTLNKPESLNSLEQGMFDELCIATREIARDDEIKAVIITGSGKAFCAGGDLNRFKEGFDHFSACLYVEGLHLWCKDWICLEKPTIAAVNGAAIGAGLSIALMSDFIIAADSAKFGSAFINMGLAPDFAAAYYLPRIVGVQKAKELFYTGRNIDSCEALAIGLVNKVVPGNELITDANELAAMLSKKPAFAMKNTKALIDASLDMDLKSMFTLEKYIQSTCLISDDSKEAVEAFLDRRKPVFKDR